MQKIILKMLIFPEEVTVTADVKDFSMNMTC